MKKIVILGGGESGCGAAVLAKKQGFNVFVSDSSEIKKNYKKLLVSYDISWEEGSHSYPKILDADIIIKSPGIPEKAEIIKKIVDLDIELIDEIEFASRYTNAKLICITGSNGKTTTVSLIFHILKYAGLNVSYAGNIGKSLALQVAENDYDYYVVELSSFQLDRMFSFKADFAAIMNITPDHLDRYEYDINLYTRSKFRISRNMKEDDLFLYSSENKLSAENLNYISGSPETIAFKIDSEDALKVTYNNRDFSIDKRYLPLKGKHNLYNYTVAIYASLFLGIEDDLLKESLLSFMPIAHRLESVDYINGIEFINDSKATNVDSCWYALDAMNKPVIWIAGGVDKGNDYSLIADLVKEKVKVLICLGEYYEKLDSAFKDIVPKIYKIPNLDSLMDVCLNEGEEGDVVLLSPCCASFDLFTSYIDRGNQFKDLIQKNKK